jgi:hypothetical protein
VHWRRHRNDSASLTTARAHYPWPHRLAAAIVGGLQRASDAWARWRPRRGLNPLELWSGCDNPAKQQYERHAMASFVTLHADNSEDVYHVNMDFVILMARFQDQHTNLTFAQDVRRNITVRETPEQIMEMMTL